jgi:hypothetical protein
MARLTKVSYTDAVFQDVTSGKYEDISGVSRVSIMTQHFTVLGQFAERVRNDRALAPYLQKEYNALAFAGGVADLSTFTDLHYGSIALVIHSTEGKLSRLRSRADLDYPRSPWLNSYAIEANKLYAKKGDRADLADGTVVITAVIQPVLHDSDPLLTTIPEQLNYLVIAMGTAYAIGEKAARKKGAA